ncbi:MAG: DNA repair protein RecO [Candidatus Magasanikbacteria bacterium RIFCSPHIGHO2_01_FULL_41_23]|uniref:DNA repair protein RecO n=1 Tax=Candidatus Magasanikbacteria bacterium RIFCSPLOWO2_01_FULL_40_15 TaxID=1798686 RepID=A0A1F6N270_9BACT|nr:MAG: DNA repair protein RecO [Candidatus Magasanikbacteria bacterium RIFCSPHIGHO2_01_FULL_41_23]OGH66837.1 MAG: DNA repair protein RecO [Candidatus Magasanikbacteria bacterium RIFCSPHIGHO2_02_FULL_41_35]OGH74820.1 MAG: DNA repair protein RecO [Candidatus Magasanikbacteria bacterium RIFCSPHIGHO2_12_FULL_41_16]OGH78096.1 MAG: DNA repair protein RecO [Candidatus Magasanikbacteria bacterium RIFCSPLOWO2_01_FULL_40_15]
MKAIVLSRRSHREYDEIISLYTYDNGRVEVLAKGNKKIVSKQSPFLEPFSIIECAIIPGREIDHLAKTQSVEYFPRIRQDEFKSRAGIWAATLTRALTPEHVPDKHIFFALKNWLEFLEKIDNASPIILDAFAIVLMRLLGFIPQLEECVICHKEFKIIAHDFLANENKLEPGIYYAGGGLVCGQCRLLKQNIGEEIAVLGLQELSALSLLVKGDWRLIVDFEIEKSESIRLHEVVYKFVLYHSEVPLRNWGFLFTMSELASRMVT